MRYGLSIDWLSFLVKFDDDEFITYNDVEHGISCRLQWGYKKQPHGTRQFRDLYEVFHGGEPFAEVQCNPYSGILERGTGIVKINNRLLYSLNMWYYWTTFCEEHNLHVLSLSRCDICADFNSLQNYDCIDFVHDFLDAKLRHKGKGIGAAYFNHYAKKVGVYSKAVVKYTGLSFGARTSGVRVYLYNKSFELRTVKDKPYIRDFWKAAGLDISKDVWRLEVSITSQAKRFKNKATNETETITSDSLRNGSELLRIYHTFIRKYFAFVRNRDNITNISREPVIELLPPTGFYEHGTLREVSCSNRTEKILIKQLWQLSETYRGFGLHTDADITKTMAVDLASSCDLQEWFDEKEQTWQRATKK